MTKTPRTEKTLTLRAVARDKYARVEQVIEQSIPATSHAIGLFLRRRPARGVADVLLAGGTMTIEPLAQHAAATKEGK